jgi:addiction module RelB/DinJ family antitoxin
MAKVVLNVKTDIKVKQQAQKIAKEMGVPLSTIVNAQLKRFVEDREIELRAPLVPNTKTRHELDAMLQDIMQGDESEFSPVFTSLREARLWAEKKR